MSQSKDTIAILSAVKSRADRLLCRRYFPLGKYDFYLGLSDHDVIVTQHFGWVNGILRFRATMGCLLINIITLIPMSPIRQQ